MLESTKQNFQMICKTTMTFNSDMKIFTISRYSNDDDKA